MYTDERRNKVECSPFPLLMPNPNPHTQVVKDMSNNKKYCEPSIARVHAERSRDTPGISPPPPVSLETRCTSTHACKSYDDSDPLLSVQLAEHIRLHYNTVIDNRLWMVHKRAKICGVGFTAGESIRGVRRSSDDKMLRCGSIITLVSGGRSLYVWVIKFMSFDKIHLAHVRWLPIPEYPCVYPVVVLLRNNGPKPRLPCTVNLIDIDPSQVAILHENNMYSYVMRLTGFDVIRT